ncbi:MAG: ImmA/IrrE family metallo-endopeptidase [Pirellulales bacterium]
MAKQFNKEIFIVARGCRGISQADFAKKMSWSQGKVSKVEHGFLFVDEEEVLKVAQCLAFPAELFYEDSEVTGFGSCCQYDRKKLSTPVRRLSQLHDEINIRRIQVGRLLRGVDLPNELNFPDLDVDRFGGPEEVARVLRATWQLPRGPIRNLINVVESAGGIVVMCDMPIPTIDAVSQRSRGLPHMFFLDKNKPVDRCRFTLAHEIGHLVMHNVPTPEAESEADRFAAEFLMPMNEIKNELRDLTLPKAAQLKLKWRVSMQALIYHAKRIGAITDQRYKSLYVRISQLGYRKNEPNPLQPEKPKMLRSIIDLYLNERGFDLRQLSAAALCLEKEFKAEFLDNGPQLKII